MDQEKVRFRRFDDEFHKKFLYTNKISKFSKTRNP